MTPPALSFPGSREIAGLWQQLVSLQPRTLWVGHLLLHHLDAPVVSRQNRHLDPLDNAALQALHLAGPMTLHDLDHVLGLGRSLLSRLLDDLSARGLLIRAAEGRWRPTAAGEAASRSDTGEHEAVHRQALHFVDRGANFAPHYLALNHAPCLTRGAAEAPEFPIAALHALFAQAPEWKARYQVPSDWVRVLPFEASLQGSGEDVVLHRAEWLPLVLVGSAPWMGFALDPRQWKLNELRPAFTLGMAEAKETFGELIAKPSPEAWETAWSQASSSLGIRAEEAGECRIVANGCRLQVTAPPHCLEQIRARSSHPEEHWLLAGSGPLRRAALLDVIGESELSP